MVMVLKPLYHFIRFMLTKTTTYALYGHFIRFMLTKTTTYTLYWHFMPLDSECFMVRDHVRQAAKLIIPCHNCFA